MSTKFLSKPGNVTEVSPMITAVAGATVQPNLQAIQPVGGMGGWQAPLDSIIFRFVGTLAWGGGGDLKIEKASRLDDLVDSLLANVSITSPANGSGLLDGGNVSVSKAIRARQIALGRSDKLAISGYFGPIEIGTSMVGVATGCTVTYDIVYPFASTDRTVGSLFAPSYAAVLGAGGQFSRTLGTLTGAKLDGTNDVTFAGSCQILAKTRPIFPGMDRVHAGWRDLVPVTAFTSATDILTGQNIAAGGGVILGAYFDPVASQRSPFLLQNLGGAPGGGVIVNTKIDGMTLTELNANTPGPMDLGDFYARFGGHWQHESTVPVFGLPFGFGENGLNSGRSNPVYCDESAIVQFSGSDAGTITTSGAGFTTLLIPRAAISQRQGGASDYLTAIQSALAASQTLPRGIASKLDG